jgi:hypothetical protein
VRGGKCSASAPTAGLPRARPACRSGSSRWGEPNPVPHQACCALRSISSSMWRAITLPLAGPRPLPQSCWSSRLRPTPPPRVRHRSFDGPHVNPRSHDAGENRPVDDSDDRRAWPPRGRGQRGILGET